MDSATVDGFGLEWTVYDQSERDPESIRRSFERYFERFPFDELDESSLGLDVGCGTGRWASQVLDRGPRLVALDASAPALRVAARTAPAAALLNASAVELPLADDSVDFGFSLGVLHHLPDTEGALREIHRVLVPGAPFLVYLYYAFDNRPGWFRALWKLSDLGRRWISGLPHRRRLAVTRVIAATTYWPLARFSKLLEGLGKDPSRLPLSAYRDQPFYVMRTDALDRFGTGLEKRYTRD
ncbi:MAG: class I SAM-dependent methyltransferase [Microthrixaceae bacterium]|nr:class I SAM-dependent methyltransferase [Microthrixaceae bacterium]